MKRLILTACLATLGLAGMASAHPPEYVYRPVYRPIVIAPPVITAPVIVTPVIIQPAPIVTVEVVRPAYFWGHHWR